MDKGSKYIGRGILVDDELFILDINIIENPHYWGIAIITKNDEDDSDSYIEAAELTDNIISTTVQMLDLDVTITVYRSRDSYDISMMYKKSSNRSNECI